MSPFSLFFNHTDEESKAISALLGYLRDKEAEFCKDKAEDLFRDQQFLLAVYAILEASIKNPNLPAVTNCLHAYLLHQVAYKTNSNYYAILDIYDHCAGIKAIKKNYREMALACHPDKLTSVAAESATKLINSAWEVLSDPRRREAYDRSIGYRT